MTYSVPLFYNLLQDPKEERPSRLVPDNLWVRYPASQVLIDTVRELYGEAFKDVLPEVKGILPEKATE